MFIYGVISVSVAPIRKEPDHSAEQVTQLLFGEKIFVTSHSKDNWIKIQNQFDSYEGWILKSQFIEIPVKLFHKNTNFHSTSFKDLFVMPNNKGHIRLSPGSDLFLLKKNEIPWYHTPIAFKGKKINRKKLEFSEEDLLYYAKMFLGTPYLWGGRSIHGIDCSGFTQVIFKLLGCKLPRDAYQQADMGETVPFLQDGKCGDLAFFDDNLGRVNHVGILLNNHTIIHASEANGGVTIDSIDQEGIISSIQKMRTHKLRIINRYF